MTKLNTKELLALAEDRTLSTIHWARFMTNTRNSRKFFNDEFKEFQSKRLWCELGVKTVVTVTLGVGLFWAAPATLLYGASLTLGLSSLIYAFINVKDYEVSSPALGEGEEESPSNIANFDKDVWEKYRTEWVIAAKNHNFSANQKELVTRMAQVGMALVIGFAAFTAISSGLAMPLAISTILFSGTLFERQIDDAAPYVEGENNKLPALTAPGVGGVM